MTKNELYTILSERVLVLDGATGTLLQNLGMPKGACPEEWVFNNPEALIKVQKNYKKAGSDIIYTCSLGGNRIKLSEFGLGDKTYEINKKLAQISKEAVGISGLVAGDLGPTGRFVEPFGDLLFEEAVSIYKEQAKALLDGGVDLFVIETMIDIQEMRAAIIGIKEVTDAPIIACMTFSIDGFTLTGTDPISALITLQSLGAAVVGLNCSTGPDAMIKIIQQIKPYAYVPIIAKPNAGLPRLINGETVFDMSPEEFASFVPKLLESGANLIGGCCGTTYDYINLAASHAQKFKPIAPLIKSISALSSARQAVFPGIKKPLSIVGERINPTGKKKLQAELKEEKFDEVKRFAVEQKDAGAVILDVNMGMAGINEKDMMVKTIKLLSGITTLPICIDSSSPEVIEAALRIYPGRALINSISAEKNKLKDLLPIAAKYGAMFILLPLNDEKIPDTADERKEIIRLIMREAEKYGYVKEDMVVDGLVMTVSSDQKAALETLKLINWCTNELRVNTIVGLSNVSFGLPNRQLINANFLSMAIANGLSMAIANPCEEAIMNAKRASDALMGNDKECRSYISRYANIEMPSKDQKNTSKSPQDEVYDAVLSGDKENIIDLVKKSLDTKISVDKIVDDYLIKAINKVGEFYEKKIYFLPQLISSAEAMKAAFGFLEPMLLQSGSGERKVKHKIILATVKGDIHDIGKNIVSLMLKNYGFDVIDLGKDVANDRIIEEAKKQNPAIIGLSALMTTTMIEMKNVVQQLKLNAITAKVIVGGAVITEQYAEEISADGYARDGIEAVKLVKKLLNLN